MVKKSSAETATKTKLTDKEFLDSMNKKLMEERGLDYLLHRNDIRRLNKLAGGKSPAYMGSLEYWFVSKKEIVCLLEAAKEDSVVLPKKKTKDKVKK